MTTQEKRSPFSKWYESNKEKLAQKRAAKYKADPDYRQKALERSAKQRANNPRPKVTDERHFREINGQQVEVFRIGVVAARIGRDEQTIRLWEDKELIPKPTAPGKHRYYTQHQVALMRELAETIGFSRYDAVIRRAAITEKSQFIHSQWEII